MGKKRDAEIHALQQRLAKLEERVLGEQSTDLDTKTVKIKRDPHAVLWNNSFDEIKVTRVAETIYSVAYYHKGADTNIRSNIGSDEFAALWQHIIAEHMQIYGQQTTSLDTH